MRPWDGAKPTTFRELFDFYNRYVKLLYSEIQTENTLPVETLFELNAALDHVSKHWAYGESEADAVGEAYSHLKRSCLDIFKLEVREARRQYDELCSIDISVVDNSKFERELHHLFGEIRRLATEARRSEGQPDTENSVPAFELWEEVFVKCQKLEEEFFLHPEINWARKRGILISIRRQAMGFFVGVLASLIAAFLWSKVFFSA